MMTTLTTRTPPRASFAGAYQILEQIAQGAHGPIHRGKHRHSETAVAIQFLADPDADRYDPARCQFVHPALLPVVCTGIFAGLPFVVSALAFGPTFLGRFDNPTRGPIDSARLILALADAVALLHESGIVHLRLSPANVVVDQGLPVLLDLGTARHLTQGCVHVTRMPSSADFAAPEQMRLGASLTTATDVYQLGAMLYAALTGRAPGSDPRAIARLPRHVPRRVAQVCERALRMREDQSIPDATAFVSALREALSPAQSEPSIGGRVTRFFSFFLSGQTRPLVSAS